MLWYCIATAGRKERTAAAALDAKEIETFAPRHYETRGGRLTNVPLFPGYVLALVDLSALQELLALWRLSYYLPTVGIHSLVGICGKPTIIETDFIEELKTYVNEDGIFIPPGHVVVARTYPEIKPGERVRITGGPYVGLIASFSRMKGIERSVVLTSMFGRECPVEVNRDDLELLHTELL